MYLSLALLLFSCFAAGRLCSLLKLPPLFGYMICGLILGPACLNLFSQDFLDLSAFLRKCALIIILCRAGLGLDLKVLRQNGLSSALMCFLPAFFEIAGYVVFSGLLGFSIVDALILGCVMGAVSPAVIVPRMLKLSKKHPDSPVPSMVLTGASMDDIVVVTLFTSFMALAASGSFTWTSLLGIPVSIVTGAAAGLACGYGLAWLAKKWNLESSAVIIMLLALSFLFVWIEDLAVIPFASLLGVVCAAVCLRNVKQSFEVSKGLNSLWKGGEMILFALVGALVDPASLSANLWLIVLVMAVSLLFRAAGVWVSLLPSSLSGREKLFCVIAYLPKATVQAAIGSLPLAAGMACGSIILSFAAVSILITAPVGAFLIDHTSFLLDPKV